jgi:predicted MFS family arabinose efflux permease
LIGSFSSGLIAQAGIAMGVQFAIISALAIPTSLILRTRLLPDEKRPTQPTSSARRRKLALPSRTLLPLGITIICVALGEETINNWVALYMRSDLGSNPAIAGFAYTAFAIATFTGRIFGDKVISRIGVDRVITGGALLAASGIAFGIIVNQPWSMVVGYTIVGAGLSVMVPVTYRRAGETPGMSPADAVSQVASIGFLGFMLGPILIGLLSDLFSLRLVLGFVAISLLGIVAMVRLSPSGEQVTVQDRAPRIRPRAIWRPRSRPRSRSRSATS